MLTSEQKQAINQLLKDKKIDNKKEIFDAINQGMDFGDVLEWIGHIEWEMQASAKPQIIPNDYAADFAIFGQSLITQNAIDDMSSIMTMPFVLGGALMPDSHRVAINKPPVGSVIVSDAVVPAYVGSDISCSVRLTVTDMLVNDEWFAQALPSIKYVLTEKARFGLEIQPDPVVFDYQFYNSPLHLNTEFGRSVYEYVVKIARNHFATCGEGNHFFEFGWVDVTPRSGHQLPLVTRNASGKARHLAMLSHFGSRAVGSTIASAYEKLAAEQYTMPKGITDAPLDPNSPDGADYMSLMYWAGEFAEAGHDWLHRYLMEQLAERVDVAYSRLASIFSRHNSMWVTNDGYVHRKGATPTALGQMAVIPATMGHATQIVSGLGNPLSFGSASHGGGRTHSRGQALQAFSGTHEYVEREYGVTLIGGDADEDPRSYKDINEVMKAQADCVTKVGEFHPVVVRMASARMPFWKLNKGKK